MGQTNKIWRTYISAKALSMDIGTSAVEEIVKNGRDIISGYFRGQNVNFLIFRKAVKPCRGKVKQKNGNKCVPTI